MTISRGENAGGPNSAATRNRALRKKKVQISAAAVPHLEALQNVITEQRHEWSREERRALFDAIRPYLPIILKIEGPR